MRKRERKRESEIKRKTKTEIERKAHSRIDPEIEWYSTWYFRCGREDSDRDKEEQRSRERGPGCRIMRMSVCVRVVRQVYQAGGW